MQPREIYLENYWLSFLDFIEVFGQLAYKNIPLPLLANFYQHLDNNLKEEMAKHDFKDHLTKKNIGSTQIQPQFDQWLDPLKKPLAAKPLPGKVVLNFDYLRFSQNNYLQYFDPKQTVIFARWEKNDYLGFPVHCIKRYQYEVKDKVNELIGKAKAIFSTVKTHPIFNNEYFYNTFIDKIPQMVETIAAVNRYFKENPISCVIVGTTEDLISRILTIAAAGRGIPSICMQHGLLGGDEAYIPVFSTVVAVYGHYEKQWYQKKGLAEDRIAITGHPRFDDIFTQRHMTKAEFQKTYDIDSRKKTILLATQPGNVQLWNGFIEILAQEPQLEIIIKPHPWELPRGPKDTRNLMANYEYFAGKYKSVKLIAKKGVNLYDFLPNVDAVVINLSTVGLEAMFFKKPLFLLSDKHFDYFDILDDFKYANPAELAQFITKHFNDNQLQKLTKNKRAEFLAYAYPQKIAGVRLLEKITKLTKA